MIERLRALLDRQLEPSVARAALLFALAVGAGFAIVTALAGVDHATTTETAATRSTALENQGPRVPSPGTGPAAVPTQDPQDRPGSAAHGRAAAELADHRALQHVPFEGDGASIDLVDARGGRAVLRVLAATSADARRGWHAFLRRFDDRGDAYIPRFEGGGRCPGAARLAHLPARLPARHGARLRARRSEPRKRPVPQRSAGCGSAKNLRSPRHPEAGS